jgi:serine/threonine protein kinase
VLIAGNFKIEEFITLAIIKQARASGPVKKVLHVPSCKIFCVKEQPLTTKESRNNLREWLNFWQNRLSSANPQSFVKVYHTFWNSPEGCVSILEEYCAAGSLENLIDFYFELPEECIRDIAEQTLALLQEMTRIAEQGHGGLLPSQILFSRDGQVKLSEGRNSKVRSGVSVFALSSNKFADKINPYESFYVNKLNRWAKLSKDPESNQDVYSLGMILLYAALGGFGLVERAEALCEKAKAIYSSGRADSACCLLHLEDDSFVSLLAVKCTDRFLDFLCRCLQISAKKRASLSELLAHPYIAERAGRLPIALKEFLRPMRGERSSSPDVHRVNRAKLTRVVESINIILHHTPYNKDIVRENLADGALELIVEEVGCSEK